MHADEWGNLQGQVVVAGDLPELPLLVKKGDSLVRDAICREMDVPDESLVVDRHSRGLMYAFVYLKDPPSRVHPDGRRPPVENPVITIQGCRYFPHALVVRTGKTLDLQMQRGEASHLPNFVSTAGPVGCTLLNEVHHIGFRQPERLPLPLRCEIHPWMRANLLVTDHPYATVTDHQGRFTIKNLPTGEQTFRVWHELPGYLVREWKVTIAADKTLETPLIEIPVEKLARRTADSSSGSTAVPAAAPGSPAPPK